MDNMKNAIPEYCAKLGKDSLLVQGAGGNVSWKENDTLWIKASGTWLSEAENSDIFVPVDLQHLREELRNQNFGVTPKLKQQSQLKPSIETVLHALMPHRIVVHLHAVEVLAHLVRDNCEANFQKILADTSPWVMTDYYKPGEDLARAVSEATSNRPDVDIVFLHNHGLVIGGDNIDDIDNHLTNLTTKLGTLSHRDNYGPASVLPVGIKELEQYEAITDNRIQQLALEPVLFEQTNKNWALYPDHIVFLGAHPNTFNSVDTFIHKCEVNGHWPELIFIKDVGVFAKTTFSQAKYEQLFCYYNVLVRQDDFSCLKTLSKHQIDELINWDAEKYRMKVAK